MYNHGFPLFESIRPTQSRIIRVYCTKQRAVLRPFNKSDRHIAIKSSNNSNYDARYDPNTNVIKEISCKYHETTVSDTTLYLF